MNNLNETFGIESAIQGEIIMKDGSVIVPDANGQGEKIDYDYNKTRDNLHSLLAQGQDALMCALEVAKSSEEPRAFEVVGMLVKQLSEVNAQLLDLHDKKQKLDGKYAKNDDNNTKNITNNAIFVGSTTALSAFLKKNND